MRRAVYASRAVATAAAAALCFAVLAAGPSAGAADGRPGEIARLYAEAARDARAYETVGRAVVRERQQLSGLRQAALREQRRLGPLRDRLGQMARTQYRDGGVTPPMRLLQSDSPGELLERARLLHGGDHATALLLAARDRAQRRLATATAKADQVLDQLAAHTQRQAVIKRRIQAALKRARALLLRQQAQARPQHCPRARPSQPFRPAASDRLAPAAWVSPVDHYRLTAGFGRPGRHWAARHTGQDFAVPPGTPVRAVGDGVVILSSCGDGFGNQIVIQHSNGYFSHYAHLSLLQAYPGDRVHAGDRIGLSGDSGNSTGPHLHFEVRVTPLLGSGVDPVPWMAEHGVSLLRE